MKKDKKAKYTERKEERGAAMVMALLISFLLLIGGAGLILETSMNSANVTDATAEQQAYNAAESGIQSAVNVFRGNVVPNPLIDSSKPATDKANKISFVKALSVATSNVGTSGNDASARLSRWMSYTTGYPDRVQIGPSGTAYSPQNGFAYKLQISDPDNTGSLVSYSTYGRLYDCDLANPLDVNSDCADMPYSHKTYGTGSNLVRVTYIPTTVSNLNVAGGATATDIGKFKVEITGNGAVIPAFNRFEVLVTMTVPYSVKKVIRGYIETNSSSYTTPPKVIIDSQTFTMQGSDITLNFNSGTFVNFPNALPQRVGYEASLNLGENTLSGTMSSPEPQRLLIKSTGYGPRGAVKQLEAIIQKDFFNGLSAPATLTLVGPRNTASPSTSFKFDPGSSTVTTYSGDDVVSTDIIPPIGTTDATNLDDVQASVDRHPPHPFNGTVVGTPSNVTRENPDWLQSPKATDQAVHTLYNTALGSADSSNTVNGTRYFPSGTTPSTFGNNTTATGITFCDGDVTFTGDGGGILVVTGKLTLHGNFSFNGLIIVTGQGGIDRSGGGNGVIQGNIVVAPYVNSKIVDVNGPPKQDLFPADGATFLAPQYDLSGGGNSTVTYNSSSVANGLTAVSNFVLGVVEK